MNVFLLSSSIVALLLSIGSFVYAQRVYVKLKVAELKGTNLHFLSVDQLGMSEKEIDSILNQDLDDLA